MRTIPLHGKKAAGRVALVDDGDYELASQYRWLIEETARTKGKRDSGPYAITWINTGTGKRTAIRMHNLITGITGVDHRDHDGLNNQRSNLRAATAAQNLYNARGALGATSEHKGVFWNSRRERWQATVTLNAKLHHLGFYISETEAALAYDDAAREYFGEFAYLNFPDGIPQAIRNQLRAEREAADAERLAVAHREQGAKTSEWWAQREPETRICTVCGGEYLTRQTRISLYCGAACSKTAQRRRDRERATQPEPAGPETLICPVCGRRFVPGRSNAIYCGYSCAQKACLQRKREQEAEGRLF